LLKKIETKRCGDEVKMPSKPSILFLAVLACLFVMVAPQIAGAQICPGSNLFYVARDNKGAIIDAGRSEIKYEGDGSTETYMHWKTEAVNADRMRSKIVPGEISKLDGKVALKNQAMCIFKNDVKLRVTLAGTIMNLVFHMPGLSEYDSKDFVVDSLPFKAGDYEITLNVPPETWVNYYPASAWKKTGNKP
jgi:hypothetical protein